MTANESKLSIYRYRLIWSLLSILIIALTYIASPYILPPYPACFEKFSYWGTTATIIALMITILEIIQNAKITKTIAEKVNLITDINKTALLAESSEIINQVVDAINTDRFSEATILMRELQKKLLYSQSDLMNMTIQYQGKEETFASLERKIEAYRASNASAPVSKSQKNIVKGALISLKEKINEHNPGRR